MSTSKLRNIGIVLALVVGMLIGGAIIAVADHEQFSDEAQITPAHVDSIHDATITDIANGFADGTFRPLQDITRQETTSLVMRARANVLGELEAATTYEVEADAPYPSQTTLEDGDNSTEAWPNDNTKQSAWVRCPEGKVATGGGYGDVDQDDSGIRVTTNMAAAISDDGAILSSTGEYLGGPHDQGPPDNSLVNPNGWFIEGYNNGPAEVVMRPQVICIDL